MADDKIVKLFSMERAAQHFSLDMIKYVDCARWAADEFHPKGAFCPGCSAPVLDSQKDRYSLLKTVRCHKCQKNFTALTGTLLNTSKLDIREVYMIAVFSFRGMSVKAIAAQLGVHHHTVKNWQAHFRAQQDLEAPKPSEVSA